MSTIMLPFITYFIQASIFFYFGETTIIPISLLRWGQNIKGNAEFKTSTDILISKEPFNTTDIQSNIEDNNKTHKENDKIVAPTENLSLNSNDNEYNLQLEVTNKGSLKLELLGYFIKNNLRSNKNIDMIIFNATNDYKSQVKQYFDSTNKKVVKNAIDRDFLILDKVESTNTIMKIQAKALLSALIDEANTNFHKIDISSIIDKIKYTVDQEKIEVFAYICQKLNVCRKFPGFSDVISQLISKLLRMPDKNLGITITNLVAALLQKHAFINKVMREPVINKLSSKLSIFVENLEFMKVIFSALRSAITQRYKTFNSAHTDMTPSAKAVRILLDVIDKAFVLNDDDVNTLEMDVTVSELKEWASGSRIDIDLITRKFVFKTVEILDRYWSPEVKEEVKVLTDIVITGCTNNKIMYNNLFSMGSSIVRSSDQKTLIVQLFIQ